jgi:hypothetical protein
MRPTSTGVRPPALLTLADIQRRGAELLGTQPLHQAGQEPPPALEQPYPASLPPPQPQDPGYRRLPAAALHGLAETVVRRQLVALDAASCPTTLWTATAGEEREENEAWEADLDLLAAEEEGLISLISHFYLANAPKRSEKPQALIRSKAPASPKSCDEEGHSIGFGEFKAPGPPDTIASRRRSPTVLAFSEAGTHPPPGKPSPIVASSKSWAVGGT